jgi:flagellar basal-body rod protein FlgG
LPCGAGTPAETGTKLPWHTRCSAKSVNVSLYQAAAAMNAQSRWQEIIAENLAAAAVPGYKRQDLAVAAVRAGLMPAGAAVPQHFALPQARPVTNFTPGELKHTGVATDVAIEGRGFFEVQLPNGARAYTRDGEFRLNADGQLTTKHGHLVLGQGGPIQLERNNPAPVTISPAGQVSQGADVRGQLKLVDFNQPQLLTPISGGLFLPGDPGLQSRDVDNPVLRQGFLEAANTSAVIEMANLIAASRMFEANQRLIQTHDERLAGAIRQLGDPRP